MVSSFLVISSLVMRLSPESVKASSAAGEPIILKLTRAPGNKAPIGGLKVVTASRAGRLIAIAIVGMEERGVLLRRPQKSAGRRARAR